MMTFTKIKFHGRNFFGFIAMLILLSVFTGMKEAHAQSGNLDQSRNGSSGSPTSPVQWVNGNAGSSNSHYLESMSIPYRMLVTGLSAGTHTIDLEWDVKQGGAFAIDYITQFNRLEPHAQFSHTAEIVNPLTGLSGINATPVTYPIPAPPSNIAVACTGILQPQASFNALPANERVMTMYNGASITNMQYLNVADLNASASSQQLRITFTTTNSSVLFAWGGHIGAAADWCPGNSASAISGSPYHMRLLAVDGGGGNQDRSLSAAAVIPVPPCNISGSDYACRSALVTYSVSPYIGYTYSWSLTNNTSGASISGSNTGTSVNVNTGNSNGTFTLNLLMSTSGFTGTCTKIITVNKPSVSETHVNYSCSNNAGSVNLTVSGGFPLYSFVWSNGATTEDVSGLNAGSYTVTVSDQASCGTSLSVNITSLSSLTVSSSVTNVSCNEGNNGSVNLNLSGGSTPYSYQWNNGATTQNISGLGAGTYSVIVTGATGCTAESSATVTQPSSALAGNINSIGNVSCYNGSNGSVNMDVSGGTPPYSFQWNNGATTQNISNVSAGTYAVTVTDSKGCTSLTSSISVTQPSGALAATASSVSDVSCFGGNNGLVNLNVSGGTAPYSYNWSNGATTQNISGLSAGNYIVTVIDANGCYANQSQTVTQPAGSLSSNVSSASNVSCNGGNNGTINLNVSGGTIPYSYSWSNGSTTQNLNGVTAGNYTVTITDANGCSTVNSGITVSQPPVALNGNASSISTVSCWGGNNGSINLSVNGGAAPYSYSWSNGANTQNISNLSAGNYSVIVTDIKGCTTSVSGIAVTQPGASLNSSVASTGNINCFGGNNGSINLNVIGGTAPYSYNWSNGATTQNLINVTAGSYNVSVTDVNGCTSAVAGIVISQPGASLNGNVIATSAVSCFGGSNGSIILNVNGGTAPYSYNWSNGSTSQNLNNVQAGTYSVTITDVNGCLFNISGQTIAQPPAALNSSVGASSNVSCFGGNNGSITLNVSGGTAPYIFNWSNGANTQNLSNIVSGTYSVIVTDANGCTTQTSSIVIGQPGSVLNGSAATTQNVSCNSGANGTVTLTVAGGTAPYIYNWSNGATTQNINGLYSGTYVVTVTDAQGCLFSASAIVAQPTGALNSAINVSQNVNCFGGNNGSILLNVNGGTAPYIYNWSNGASTQNLNNLSTGTYSVTITDANGCINVASASVNQPSAALNGTASSTTNVSCFGGNNGGINLSVNGGTAPYSYQWSNGASSQNISNLAAGTYTVTVTDVNRCSTIVSGIAINQPTVALNGNTSSTTNVSCFGGNNGGINLVVNGGTAPYSYNWSNGANTQNISNLAAGTYTLTVTDANGCVTTVQGIAINEPAVALNGNVSAITNVNCFGGNNGNINLNVIGGTEPYSYNWSNGATTQNISNLAAGTYTVSVTDINGCSTNLSGIAITEPAGALSASVFGSQNVNCYSGANGSIDLTTINGTAPYLYNWSNGASTEDINNLSAGTYTVIVTDANGCVFTTSSTVSQPNAALNVSTNITQNVSCNSGANGAIDLTAADGTAPYTYNWSNGETTEDIGNLISGEYSVIVTDANGCVFTTSATVAQPAGALNASANVLQNVNCYSGANGSIDLTPADGTAPYTFVWSNGATTEDINNLSAGTYTVVVTDSNGCAFTTLANISQPNAALNASANVSQNVSCYSGANGSIDLTVTDGTSPYSFNWSNGSTTEDINNLSAGTYNVTISDANGCVTNAYATISQPNAALNASANILQNVSCYLGANGSIDLTATNGTAPYVFVWSNGSTTEDINNLSAGTYNVTITDANGCVTNASATISQPNAALNASANVSQNVSCYSGTNDSIDLTATDGTSPYSFNWSNGSTTEDINNLSAGTYNVTITDANGCVTNASATISQPNAALNASANVSQNVSCYSGANGSIDLTATDGTAPYVFDWSNGETTEDINNLLAATYNVTITDANGCITTASATISQPNAALDASANVSQNVSCYSGANGSIDLTATDGTAPYVFVWSNGSTTEDINNLSAGTYNVTITDANGCITTASATISQPNAALNASANVSQNVSCYSGANGSIDLTATDGTAPYSFVWSNGATTEDINNLSAGTYNVTITDANGCVTTVSANITQPNAALNASANISQNVSCYSGANGSIDLTATDGTAPYTFNWSNGATSEDINNLSAGTYTVIVTDANGCSTATSGILTQPQASLSVSGSGTISNCLNNIPGNITISVNGGTSPYSYLWNNGATSQNLNNQSAGTYTVTITDANGCNTLGSYVITDNSVFHAEASGPAEVCMGEVVTLVANSVTAANYQWYYNGQAINGANNNVLVTPMGGTYFVTVNNSCGSFTSDSIVVKVHQMDNITTSPNVIVCQGESTQLYATGGVSYEWTPANSLSYSTISNPIATPTEATQYIVTITNEFGCSTTAMIEVGMCDTLIIPSGYSPNNDAVNDFFEIKGIEHYPGNKLWIYNRWGNMIYKAHDYDNSWNGISNVSGVYIGKRVPPGTYFYVLDLNTNTKPLQGYVVLKY